MSGTPDNGDGSPVRPESYERFRLRCVSQTALADAKSGRRLNRNALSPLVRESAYRILYYLIPLGIRGHHLLFTHFIFDLIMLMFVYINKPWGILSCLLMAHWLDNMDGTAARYHNEAHEDWGRVDVLLHTLTTVLFFIILGIEFHMEATVMVILGARVLMEWHRQQVTTSTRWGEKSRSWWAITLPTNVNIMLLIYAISAFWGFQVFFITGYATYLGLAALGQIILFIIRTFKKTLYCSTRSRANS